VCVTQTQKEKGKTKEKGNHYETRATPALSSKVTKEKEKKAPVKKIPMNRRACSYTTGDAANDTATRRPAAAPSIQRLLLRWIATSGLLGLDLQSQTAEEARLLLLGLLGIGVSLIGFLCCCVLLGVKGVLAVGAVVGGQSLRKKNGC
jgi:hypothetical protein